MTTWDDGTTRSTGNAFDILYQPRAPEAPAKQKGKTGPKPKQCQQLQLGRETDADRAALGKSKEFRI